MLGTFKALCAGGLIGAALASIDGALLGVLVGSDGAATVRWALYFAVGGAVLGALAAVALRHMTLKPPTKPGQGDDSGGPDD